MAIGGIGAILLLIIAALLLPLLFLFPFGTTPYWMMVATIVFLVAGFTNLLKTAGLTEDPMVKTVAKVIGVILAVYVLFVYGVFGFTLANVIETLGFAVPAAIAEPISDVEVQQMVDACKAGITEEEMDDAASVTLNSYDLAADAAYGTVIDLTTDCRFYVDGNNPEHFAAVSTDTSAQTESGYWGIGASAFIYCGGTSYYTEPVEGFCIDGKVKPLVIKSYGIINAAGDLTTIVYDKKGTVLTAAGNTTTADYDLTLAANQQEKVFVEFTLTSGTEAYNLGSIITGVFNDIDDFKPDSTAITAHGLTQEPEVNFLKNVQVSDDGVTAHSNATVTYDVWSFATPVLLLDWNSVEISMLVDAGATDPSATDNVWSTIDGAIICGLDHQYSKGSDGPEYLDYHNHVANAEADVGYTNTIYAPVGGSDCAVIQGN